VTGASSGIGAAFARLLARDGYELTIVARRGDRLESLAEGIQRRYMRAVEILPIDLAHEAGLEAAERRIDQYPNLELLVNNAGRASLGYFSEIDSRRHDSDIRLNVIALTRLTRAALPRMLKQGHGAIINVSSIGAFTPGPWEATYFATKAYVSSLTEALHEELRGTGVQVQALCPGFTHSEFTEVAGIDASEVPDRMWQEPEEVVEASLAALKAGKLICVPGRFNRTSAATMRLLPRRLVRRMMGTQTRRLIP
jgi:short-subunit dehydrogenase